MSHPRIERAEILSLRLVVPLRALDQLRESCPLPLELERSEDALKVVFGECSLSFRRDGEIARLSDVCIRSDERGSFFRDVLCALMSEHAGDLHAKLAWRAPDRENGLGSAEVRIRRGEAQTSMSAAMRNVVDNLRHAAQPLFDATHPGEPAAAAEAGEAKGEPMPHPDAELLAEVDKLLEDGRRHYAEYLRLRHQRTGQ